MTTPYLRIRDLSKRFGDFTALDNVNIDIYRGEFVCFLGPSGCGKTTLLRAISGLDIQTHGTVEQDGRDISALPPAQRDFGIVFQSYALFQNLTVARNIAYGLENRKQPRAAIQQRVTELLELIGLPDSGHKYPAQLSGGQQQRVALARALAISPGLLLLDEPLSALDAKVRTHLREEIKSLQRRLGITTIMITHDQEEAISMADRIVDAGRPHRADRHAAGNLPSARQPIRGGVHRRDEPVAGDADRPRRNSARIGAAGLRGRGVRTGCGGAGGGAAGRHRLHR